MIGISFIGDKNFTIKGKKNLRVLVDETKFKMEFTQTAITAKASNDELKATSVSKAGSVKLMKDGGGTHSVVFTTNYNPLSTERQSLTSILPSNLAKAAQYTEEVTI
jgi:hypothetical protein